MENSFAKLALIILNYDSYPDTKACVDALLAFDEPFHIVIVDNASTDGSGARLHERYDAEKRVDVTDAPSNSGYSAGNNLGIRFAADRYEIDYVGILNPDVRIPDKEVLRALTEVIDNNEKCALAGAAIEGRDGVLNLNLSAWPVAQVGDFVNKQSLFTRRYKVAFDGNPIAPGLYKTGCVAGCFFYGEAVIF
jgi:GT2 family glycosyltransferase